MKPNPEPPPSDDLAQAIAEVEATLQALKQRYEQVQRDRHQRDRLQARRADLAATTPQAEELAAIARQLETLELNLESRLFRWRELREPFWHAVRFGGLGLLLGWALGFWVSRVEPEPRPAAFSRERSEIRLQAPEVWGSIHRESLQTKR